jgi:pantoate--beta-alanine ligase
MIVVEKIADLRNTLEELRLSGRKIGFVPTMGALHAGHLSLVKACQKEMSATVVSIFVNPTQFNDAHDFEVYPIDNAGDLQKLEECGGVDIVFMPKVEDIYPAGSEITVEPGAMSQVLCGMSRQGHFRGVLTVVMKLFNMVRPNAAYFGAKDYQQFSLISKMVHDLNMDIELRLGSTVREEDGLAMSSRNKNLSLEEREEAPILYQALEMGRRAIAKGETRPMEAIAQMMTFIIENSQFEIDYLAIVDPVSLQDKEEVSTQSPYVIAIAAFLGKTRLIDNILVMPN